MRKLEGPLMEQQRKTFLAISFATAGCIGVSGGQGSREKEMARDPTRDRKGEFPLPAPPCQKWQWGEEPSASRTGLQ